MSQNDGRAQAIQNQEFTQQVTGGEVPLVDDAIAVGEDLEFQESWWKFERVIWIVFALLLAADVLGVFGGGWLSHAVLQQPGLGMDVTYERVERVGTPSMLVVKFGPDAVRDGKVQVQVSDSVVKGLGAQRVIPEPESTSIAGSNMLYTFPVAGTPGAVQFELSPGAPGVKNFTLQVPGHDAVTRRVVVMP